MGKDEPMKKGVLTKQELKELFSSMIQQPGEGPRIFVPVKIDGRVELEKFSSEREISYDYRNFLKAPKSIFFPQREVLYGFKEDEALTPSLETEQIIVFGIRPCDAGSFLYLDKVFSAGSGGFADPYYIARRENSVIISLACGEPDEGCFCTSLNGGPGDERGSDIIAFDLGERLLLEAHTKKGEQFIEDNAAGLAPSGAEDEKAKEKIIETSVSALKVIETGSLRKKLENDPGERFWEEITATCLGCGICTYFCPTCHCFNIMDETDREGTGVRVRTWDSCQYPLFTRHASGHNPRVVKNQRMRQRIMHKFSYSQQTTGDTFCVGCGRCARKCPVNIDIREVLLKINGDEL